MIDAKAVIKKQNLKALVMKRIDAFVNKVPRC